MKRLSTLLGTLIALMAVSPAAEAGSYSFSISGHRFHVEAPRNCRSASCVSVSSERGVRPTDDVGATPVPPPAPTPVVLPPQPACSVAPVRPPQASVVYAPSAPAPPAPVLAAATSQPVVLPPALRLEPPRIELPQTTSLDPPRVAAPVAAPKPVTISQHSDDKPTPLGQWESTGAKGVVRIEPCGTALCGYALTEASSKGESVLVNMKPKSDGVWTGNIYSRSSGNTYYATMTLKASGKLHVEACALGHFWCSGNDWARVDEQQEKVITTSRQWSARS
ncbi:DUF2147 domain-containing protein [Bradyrhizobium sp. LTSP857]|uniref:DUF2147 domain-containing protein n=1 Tax=Bradyrhizobium sp. LTSP857 TaxID=1619231 RepID=UPI0005D16A79|nr:DUF2147 domain-containing protein [Bradyrhizobium sp. LTSP857]KJC41538.1 hypothetical protein UP06_23800 [Bradyrhizobium sp. LTSP857]